MTERHDALAEAVHALRDEIRDAIAVPDAGGLRARAARQLRVRRTTTAVAAVAAVLAVALGGGTLLRTGAAPQPPVDPPTPSGNPTSAPVSPSPRPAPVSPEPLDDPITDVDWRNATVTIPPREGCPEGPVSFVAVSDIHKTATGPVGSFPALQLDATRAAYGDLTDDGRAEAVVEASCMASADDATNGRQLLVVTREQDGALVGLGWAPPVDPGNYWIVSGRLVAEAVPAGTAWPWDSIPAGHAAAYEWDGQMFVDLGPASGYSAIVSLDAAAPVRPGAAVAAGLGCPDQLLRFRNSIDIREWPWMALTDTVASYALPPQDGPYLFDLNGTGARLLVVALSCVQVDGSSTDGLAVFERADAAWHGISVLVSPTGNPPAGWSTEGDRFMVQWTGGTQLAYRWTGTELIAIDE